MMTPKKYDHFFTTKTETMYTNNQTDNVTHMYKFHKIIFNLLVIQKSFKVQTQLQKEFGPVLKSAVNSENFGAGKSM